MSSIEVTRIKDILTAMHITPHYLEHVPVRTSQEASNVRGCKLEQGIKAILFTDSHDRWAIVNVPAHQRIDTEKVKQELEWTTIRMATAEELREQTGCEAGAVPPFGHRKNIPLLVDTGVFKNEENAFNIGLTTHSLKIRTEDIKRVFAKIGAKEGMYAIEGKS